MGEPDEFDRAWAKWRHAIADPGGPGWLSAAVGLGFVFVYILFLVLPSRFALNDMPMDALIPLDAVWRMHFGQRPHFDFITPVGDLYYLIHWCASLLTGADDPRVLAFTNALVGLPMFGLAWLATRDRLPVPLRAITATTIAVAAMSPRTLDEALLIGFNAMYNRWGWELAFVALLLVLIEPVRTEPSRGKFATEATILAGLVVALFWTKVTYFVLVCAGLGLSVLGAPGNRRLAIIAGIAGVLAVVATALTPVGAAYLADLQLVKQAASEGGGLLRASRLIPTLYMNRFSVFLVIALTFSMSRTAQGGHVSSVNRAALLSVGIAVLSLLVASQNNDQTVPVLALSALIPVVSVWRRPEKSPSLPLFAVLPTMILIAPAWSDFHSVWTYATASDLRGYSNNDASPVGQIRVPRERLPDIPKEGMVQMVLDGRIDGEVFGMLKQISWNVDSPIIVDDGVAMIERAGLQKAKISSLTFSQLFPYYFGTEPPRGWLAWMDYGRMFGNNWHLHSCDAMADTEVVMQPKVWVIEHMTIEHEACLNAEFELVDEDKLWKMWKRTTVHGG